MTIEEIDKTLANDATPTRQRALFEEARTLMILYGLRDSTELWKKVRTIRINEQITET